MFSFQIHRNYNESIARTKFTHNKIIQAEIARIEPKIPVKKKHTKVDLTRTLDKKLRWMETPNVDYVHC